MSLSPTPLSASSATLPTRFWAKVQKTDDCWLWTGSTSRGYGRIGLGGPTWKLASAHRVAYFLTTGVDPGHHLVLHRCDNPPCVNPAHLYLGDAMQNMRDRMERRPGARRPLRGERHRLSKLTDEVVREIRLRHHRDGVAMRELARELELAEGTVRSAIQRRTWRHVA